MIRIFIADDHSMFRDGIRRILSIQSGMQLVGEAGSGAELLRSARRESWDVLILDIDLGDAHGLEIIKQIKQIQENLKILVLTMHDEDQYAVRVFRAGADGYITKGSRSNDLVDAIQIVYAEGFYATERAKELLKNKSIDEDIKPPHEELSDREYEIFLLTAKGSSNQDIARELKIVPSTVSTYRKRIIEKLGLKNAAEIPHYALQKGII